jgi:hypothetical protein
MDLKRGFAALAKKLQEAALSMSHGDIRNRLQSALSEYYDGEDFPYLIDVYGDEKEVVYSAAGKLMRAPFKMRKSGERMSCSVDFENGYECDAVVSYPKREAAKVPAEPEPAVEAAATVDIAGEFVALREGAVGQDGTAFLKLIAPGWGSSGYYPAEVLERDGPKCFQKGTKNFWNHQTNTEEAERPEGDLRDLASVLTEDARYESNGPAGPGLYAKAKVFEMFKQPVDDLSKHIGMSIRATGKAKEGTAEGRKGPIIQELNRGISVDYVTTPGAGGQILQLFEAARRKPEPIQGADMEKSEVQQLIKEALAGQNTELIALREKAANQDKDLRRLRERAAIAEAGDCVRDYFKTVRVTEAIQARIAARVLAGSIPLTEAGDLDKAKLTEAVKAETTDELAYISKLTEGRVVTDMGAAEVPVDPTKVKESFDSEMGSLADAFGIAGKGKDLFVVGRAS